jgi:hypothetical protein
MNGIRACFWLLISCVGWSCSTTVQLTDKQRLVDKPPQFTGNVSLKSDDLNAAVLTRPNESLLGVKLYLLSYNLGLSILGDTSTFTHVFNKIDKKRYYYNLVATWLKDDLGEAPKVTTDLQLIEDCKNLENLYYANGFLNARVQYEIKPVITNPKRAKILFHVLESNPTIIDSLVFVSNNGLIDAQHNPIIAQLNQSIGQSAIQVNNRYNEASFSTERNRLTELYRNNGYYRFGPNQVRFKVHLRTNTIQKAQNLKQLNQLQMLQFFIPRTVYQPNLTQRAWVEVYLPDTVDRYIVDTIKVNLKFFSDDKLDIHLSTAPFELLDNSKLGRKEWEKKISYTNLIFYNTNLDNYRLVNPKIITKTIDIQSKQPYSIMQFRNTQRLLQEVGIFRSSFIRNYINDSTKTIQSVMDLTMLRRFDYRVGVEAFQAEQANLVSNLPGVGFNFQVGVRNAFKRAEQINFSINTNFSWYSPDKVSTQIFLQIGGRLGLRVPRFFLLDKVADDFRRRKHFSYQTPTTSIAISYNRERPVEYLRNTITGSYSYEWLTPLNVPNRSKHFSFSPYNLTVVNSDYEQSFIEQILGPNQDLNPDLPFEQARFLLTPRQTELLLFFEQDFKPRYISTTRFYKTMSYGYGVSRQKSSQFVRWGIEIGGNSPYIIDVLGKWLAINDGAINDATLLIGNRSYEYGQIVKGSVEYKLFIPFGKSSELVMRSLIGLVKPYLNTPITPFELRFFSGGTNSVRGWQANTLGPGVYPYTGNQILTFGGETKFEANIEYRHDFFSPIELGYFLDMGNVWFFNTSRFEDSRGSLSIRNLQLGIAAGIGFRFDLNFLVLRLDIGQQIYAPDIQDFVIKRFPRDIGFPRVQYNIGIGYPF